MQPQPFATSRQPGSAPRAIRVRRRFLTPSWTLMPCACAQCFPSAQQQPPQSERGGDERACGAAAAAAGIARHRLATNGSRTKGLQEPCSQTNSGSMSNTNSHHRLARHRLAAGRQAIGWCRPLVGRGGGGSARGCRRLLRAISAASLRAGREHVSMLQAPIGSGACASRWLDNRVRQPSPAVLARPGRVHGIPWPATIL